MFVVNEDLSIYATRGDIVFFSVSAEDNGKPYEFRAGDVVRMTIYGKKDAENVVLQKDFPVTANAEKVEIYLAEEDTKIGGVISKPTDYWYEIELNPFTNPQTIIGYDEDGAKVFKLFPEGEDIPETPVDPEVVKVMDEELDMTSTRPVQNQAIARAIVGLGVMDTTLKGMIVTATAKSNQLAQEVEVERSRIDALATGTTADGSEVVDIRVGADGVTYDAAGTAVRTQLANMSKRIEERRAELNAFLNKHGEAVTESGTAFNGVSPVAYVEYEADEETVIHTYGENALPFNVQSIASFDSYEIGEDYVTAVVEAGMTYKHFTLAPIYLKAGTYKFGFECYADDVNVYEAANHNFGVTYIYRVDDDGTRALVYALSAYDNDCHTITLSADSKYIFMPYFVVNKNITADTTVKICNIFISESAETYHEYEGETIDTALGSGCLVGFPNMNIVSKDNITISYAVADEDSNVIACWGDSLTNGTGSSSDKPTTETNDDCSYPAVLGRLLGENYTVKNFGVGGETSWQIASRQGGMSVSVLPFTMPSDTTPVRVTLHGQEQNFFYNNQTGKWSYDEDNLSYNFEASEDSGVNPCKIGGIKGNLERVSENGEYAYYFTRLEVGNEETYITPQTLITHASEAYRNATQIIWAGQNDAPLHNGQYIMQAGFEERMQTMIDATNGGRYIVMDYPSGTDADSAQRNQKLNQKFGKHYLNIREHLAKYGVEVANKKGAGIVLSDTDKSNIANGKIPSCLLSDSVHGNYWYYQIVAQAVHEKGKALGYW